MIFIILIFVMLKVSKLKNYPPPPPGPCKLPIIGNLHQLVFSPDLPHHRLRDLANKYGPLMSLQLGQLPHIVISSPEVARQVMKTHDTVFAYRPVSVSTEILFYGKSNIDFAPYGNYSRQMHKICIQELLHAKRVRSFRPIREEEVSNLIKSCITGGSCAINLSRMLFSLSYGILSKAAFGQISKGQEESCREIVSGVLEMSGGLSIIDLFPSLSFFRVATGLVSKLEKLHREADKFLQNIISQHRDRKISGRSCGDHHHDLVDILLNLCDQLDQPLIDDSIKVVLLVFFLGGTDTSSAIIEWAMSELVRNPKVMEKAQAEIRQVFDKQGKVTEDKISEVNYLKLIVKETLRLHPPGPLLLPRESAEACEINGYRITAKTRVLVNVWALGRDPDYWPEAEKFNPERFIESKIDYKGSNFEYLPFGGGRRMCPGILFGTANVELTLASLLFHFNWKLPGGKKAEYLDMTEAFGAAVRRKNALELIPLLHRPLPTEYYA